MKSLESKQLSLVKRELNQKLELEKTVSRELRSLFTTINKNFRSVYSLTGRSIDFNQYLPDVTALLRKHYNRTQRAFMFNVADFNELPLSEEQAELINTANLAWNDDELNEVPQAIIDTTDDDAQNSIARARDTLQEEGSIATPATVAAVAFALNRRKLLGRVSTIATTETQGAAESARLIEAQVLAGKKPFPLPDGFIIGGIDEVQAEDTKQWVTVGDSLVRSTHVSANGQTVGIDSLFNIGGFSMSHPSDKSNGAPVREWINCRCSSILNIKLL